MSSPARRMHQIVGVAAFALLALAGCGGGGGAGAGGGGVVPPPSSGGLPPSASLANQCDAANPLAPAANKTGSLTTEKQWLRSYFDEAYLWYSEVPTVDANSANFVLPASQVDSRGVPQSLSNYFQALKTPSVTPTGARTDRFSFTYGTEAWNRESQSGIVFGYGVEWAAISTTPPRNFTVAYVEPGSPAAAAGMQRGAKLLAVDGNDFVSGNNVAALNSGLFPATTGENHTFTIQDVGAASPRTVSVTSGNIVKDPVQNVKTVTTANGTVGYLTFNDFIATSEQQLIDAVRQLQAANITDLVLDMRYNGGGYLFIASELAYMIAGPGLTTGKNFETTVYNNKRSNANTNTPFYTTSCILVQSGSTLSCSNTQQNLPTLNLNRVYVLASGDTCSASEAVINSLRGINVDVRLIGGTTCGKPYGFTAKDNCGVSYFPIEFKGVNAQGFGDYADGFIPGAGSLPTNVPGCKVADDFTKQLGDPAEGMLAAALNFRATGACPTAPANAKGKSGFAIGSEPPVLIRPPVRENRIYLPRS
jgi:carboxyl-terminal processing protease